MSSKTLSNDMGPESRKVAPTISMIVQRGSEKRVDSKPTEIPQLPYGRRCKLKGLASNQQALREGISALITSIDVQGKNVIQQIVREKSGLSSEKVGVPSPVKVPTIGALPHKTVDAPEQIGENQATLLMFLGSTLEFLRSYTKEVGQDVESLQKELPSLAHPQPHNIKELGENQAVLRESLAILHKFSLLLGDGVASNEPREVPNLPHTTCSNVQELAENQGSLRHGLIAVQMAVDADNAMAAFEAPVSSDPPCCALM